MKILISGLKNKQYEQEILNHLQANDLNAELVDLSSCKHASELGFEFAKLVTNTNDTLGIIIDDYSVGPYNGANKFANSVCAPVTDEHSSHMTREHNGTKIIVIPTSIVALELGKSIALKFAKEKYAGGRHQIRLDMMQQIDNGGN